MPKADKLVKHKTETITDTASLFKVLADENRLRIISCLSSGTKCVCELTDAIRIPQNLMSHHLRVLKDSGLVHDERRRRWIYYSIKHPGIVSLLGRTEKFCDCQNNKCK